VSASSALGIAFLAAIVLAIYFGRKHGKANLANALAQARLEGEANARASVHLQVVTGDHNDVGLDSRELVQRSGRRDGDGYGSYELPDGARHRGLPRGSADGELPLPRRIDATGYVRDFDDAS
jgi:hypothetical protein